MFIIESTIPIGTTRHCAVKLLNKRDDLNKKKPCIVPKEYFRKCCNEIKNDRVIGGIDKKSTEIASNIYQKFCSGELVTTSCDTAEMIKLSENTFRDVILRPQWAL